MSKRSSFGGVADMDRVLVRIGKAVSGPRAVDALIAGAEPIRETAAALAPRRSGRLANSMAISEHAEGGSESYGAVATVYVGPSADVDYAEKVETGDYSGERVQPPEPYLRPAWDERKDDAIVAIAASLNATIVAAAKG